MSRKKLLKQDLNFLEYPLWFQSERLPEGFIWRDRDGFTYRAGYKPPVRIDALYLSYFLMESQKNSWTKHIVVSQWGTMKACGVSPGKTNALRLQNALERWINVTLSFHGTFYDGREYRKLQFNVINDWYLQKPSHHLEIDLNKFFLEKVRYSNFSKLLDLNILRRLKLPLAMRLYEILLKNFMYRDEWSIDAHKLAGKIPMAKVYLSHIIERLKKALDQINKHTEMTVPMTVEPYGRGKAILHFKKLKKDRVAISDKQDNDRITIANPHGVPVRDHMTSDIQELLELVPHEHRSKVTIRNTIEYAHKKYGTQYVLRNIKYTNSHCKKNYRAFLVNAIENDWGLELQEDEEAKRKRLLEQAKKAKKEEQEINKLRQVRDYIRGLSESEQQELMRQAIAELGEELEGMNEPFSKILIRSKMEQIALRRSS